MIRAKRAAALAAPDGVAAKLTHAEAGKRGGRGKKANDNINGSNGNSAAYWVARLKRDRPDLAERLVAGEFRSARAAAREAGWIGPAPTWPERVLTAWTHCTPEERLKLLAVLAAEPDA